MIGIRTETVIVIATETETEIGTEVIGLGELVGEIVSLEETGIARALDPALRTGGEAESGIATLIVVIGTVPAGEIYEIAASIAWVGGWRMIKVAHEEAEKDADPTGIAALKVDEVIRKSERARRTVIAVWIAERVAVETREGIRASVGE